ncbi:MAG: MFS transporter [bacterium]
MPARPKPFAYRFTVLFLLYLAQGLPYGFFVTALPLFLRQGGWSRTSIGFYSLLGAPWFLKPLWAPLVDRFAWPSLGRRKSWILPCMGTLAAMTVLLSFVEPKPGGSVLLLLLTVLAVNLITATQDIAVDGLAVDALSPAERGPGNVAQVAGFKVGMLLTGGLLLGLSGRIGWNGICIAMSLVCLLVLLVLAGYPEPPSRSRAARAFPRTLEIVRSVVELARRPGFSWALVLILTYKTGEAMIDAMYKVFLLDSGMQISSIGVLAGGWGMVLSLAGTAAGGWLATGSGRLDALFKVGLVRALPLIAIAVLPSLGTPLSPWVVYPVTLAEHFAGGMLTPILFAFMMDWCDRRVGATHFTVLAAVELLGKMGVGAASGWLADRFGGYGIVFGLGAGISLAWPWLVACARPRVAAGLADPPSIT